MLYSVDYLIRRYASLTLTSTVPLQFRPALTSGSWSYSRKASPRALS